NRIRAGWPRRLLSRNVSPSNVFPLQAGATPPTRKLVWAYGSFNTSPTVRAPGGGTNVKVSGGNVGSYSMLVTSWLPHEATCLRINPVWTSSQTSPTSDRPHLLWTASRPATFSLPIDPQA